jgi:hypothetical protein
VGNGVRQYAISVAICMPINRKSERQFKKAIPVCSGGEGFYIFVPGGGPDLLDEESVSGATASTVLNEAQFNRDWIEIQLTHCDGSIRGAYNFAEWLPARRDMMCWWADYLDGTALPWRPKRNVGRSVGTR